MRKTCILTLKNSSSTFLSRVWWKDRYVSQRVRWGDQYYSHVWSCSWELVSLASCDVLKRGSVQVLFAFLDLYINRSITTRCSFTGCDVLHYSVSFSHNARQLFEKPHHIKCYLVSSWATGRLLLSLPLDRAKLAISVTAYSLNAKLTKGLWGKSCHLAAT